MAGGMIVIQHAIVWKEGTEKFGSCVLYHCKEACFRYWSVVEGIVAVKVLTVAVLPCRSPVVVY